MRTKVLYCRCCHKESVHNLVDKTSTLGRDSEGFGFLRGVLCVGSLGISEIANSATVSKMYQCQSCGNILKK